MENDVTETKLRVLREAIRSNVDMVRSGRVKPKTFVKRALPIWLWGSLVVAGVASLAVPSLVVSRGKEPSYNTAAADTTKTPTTTGGEMTQAAVPLSAPHRLNRAALPLAVKRIVID